MQKRWGTARCPCCRMKIATDAASYGPLKRPSFAKPVVDTQKHGLHPEGIHAGHSREQRQRQSCRINPRSPFGHPARGRYARGRSPGSRVAAFNLAFPRHMCLSGYVERTLAAHSCGGSYGLAIIMFTDRIPVLASNPCESKEPRTLYIVYEVKIASTSSVSPHRFRC